MCVCVCVLKVWHCSPSPMRHNTTCNSICCPSQNHTHLLTGMGSLVRSLPTLFFMKPQKLNRTCGLGGMIFRRTGRVASTLWKKLGSGLENCCDGREGGHGERGGRGRVGGKRGE